MSAIQNLRERAESILTRPAATTTAAPELESLGGTTKERFTVFDPAQLERALELTSEFMDRANAQPGDAGLQDVLDTAEQAAQTEDIELVKYSLMVFITHHPEGRKLPIPPLEARAPEQVVPSPARSTTELEALGAMGDEAKLDWFREDPVANDHHTRWHVVYPFRGTPSPQNPSQRIIKNRQGELFFYMHQQMLARYDLERIGVGLQPSQPLSDFTEPIVEGYEPNLEGFSDRPPDMVMHDVPGTTTIANHETRRNRLFDAAHTGKLQNNGTSVSVTPTLLGGTVEATIESVNANFYGSFHNNGHMLLADLHDAGTDDPGVMASTSTAIRDPVFYRWHRHIDDVMYQWQQTQAPNDFAADAPNVKMRKSFDQATQVMKSKDIILCFADQVPNSGPNFNGQAFGETTFGGANWDNDFSSAAPGTDRLETMMLKRTVSPGVEISYVDQREFFYFLRLENLKNQPQEVTVRIFLTAKQYGDERRYWIEMDKFQQTLPATSKNVIFRPARFSSVVRKPAVRPTEPKPAPDPGADQNYCDCGWPYHMLLPRGTQEGMDCRLMVMVTDWTLDRVESDQKCGSMSFCGKKDADYPDKRPMGYPFDRPFTKSIRETIMARNNMAARDIKIKLV